MCSCLLGYTIVHHKKVFLFTSNDHFTVLFAQNVVLKLEQELLLFSLYFCFPMSMAGLASHDNFHEMPRSVKNYTVQVSR